MWNAVRLLVTVVVLGIVSPSSAFAQWPPLNDVPAVEATGTNDLAVIVAVEDYLLLPDVPGAVSNANDWEVFLRQGLGVRDVHVLANQDVTREGMMRFAKTAAEDVGEGGTIWWIFIGHGAPSTDGKDGLLVGVDAQQSVESLGARGLPQRELLRTLSKSGGRTVMVVDACFSGRTSDGEALAAGVQPVVAVDAMSAIGAGSVVFSAAKATEVAGQLPGSKRPAFSYLLLGAMRGWADDGDGVVTAEEALFYTRRQLRGVKGRQQTPQAAGDLQLVLSRGVDERKPSVVAMGDPTRCNEGEVLENDECVPAETSIGDRMVSKSERTLEYLQRRVVFEGRTARQAGRILEGPEFYHAIGRSDLAAQWKSHIPALWIPGIVTTIAGVAMFVYGISVAASDTASRGAKTGWVLGGTFGGFMVGIGGGVSMITFGFLGEKHPMTFAQRKSAAGKYNQELREERDLGPEVDWQNEPAKSRGGFNPFGAAPRTNPRTFGFTFHF